MGGGYIGFASDIAIGIPIQSITVFGTKGVRYRWNGLGTARWASRSVVVELKATRSVWRSLKLRPFSIAIAILIVARVVCLLDL